MNAPNVDEPEAQRRVKSTGDAVHLSACANNNKVIIRAASGGDFISLHARGGSMKSHSLPTRGYYLRRRNRIEAPAEIHATPSMETATTPASGNCENTCT